MDDLTVVCPKCHASGRVPLGFAGRDIRCKKCGDHFRVPTPNSVAGHVHVQAPPPAAAASKSAIVAALAEADDIGLAPLTPEEEVHCRERYEARVLSKDRSEQSHDPSIEKEKQSIARRI